MKAKNYPNLHRVKWTSNWVFRKYSSAKKAEFCVSTGIPSTDANASKAYRAGVQKFDQWLGTHIAHGRQPLVRDIARVVLAGKSTLTEATRISVRQQINGFINPYFGHLRPDQVTALRLQEFENQQRALGKRKTFTNTRKVMMEILRRAQEEGLIRKLPKWKVQDPAPEAPRYIEPATFWKILRRCERGEKLLLYVLWHQGARPREVCQYRWEMIHWDEGGSQIAIPGTITKTGRSRTIPLNTRVERVLRRIRKPSGPIFAKRYKPDQCRFVYNREWLRVTREMGLDLTVYNLRDSWITRRLIEGVGALFIARYVDSSVKMIESRYAVPVDSMMRRVAG